MKTQRLLVVVTLVNLALVVFAIAQTRRPSPQTSRKSCEVARWKSSIRRAVRASISVMPAGTSAHGDRYPRPCCSV